MTDASKVFTSFWKLATEFKWSLHSSLYENQELICQFKTSLGRERDSDSRPLNYIPVGLNFCYKLNRALVWIAKTTESVECSQLITANWTAVLLYWMNAIGHWLSNVPQMETNGFFPAVTILTCTNWYSSFRQSYFELRSLGHSTRWILNLPILLFISSCVPFLWWRERERELICFLWKQYKLIMPKHATETVPTTDKLDGFRSEHQ